MAIKFYCDKCGKEIVGGRVVGNFTTVTKDFIFDPKVNIVTPKALPAKTEEYHTCEKCSEAILSFIKSKKSKV